LNKSNQIYKNLKISGDYKIQTIKFIEELILKYEQKYGYFTELLQQNIQQGHEQLIFELILTVLSELLCNLKQFAQLLRVQQKS